MSDIKSWFTFADMMVALFLVVLLGASFFVVAYEHKHEIISDNLWTEASVVSR